MIRRIATTALTLALLAPAAALADGGGSATARTVVIPTDELCFVVGPDGNSVQVPVPDSSATAPANVVCVLSESIRAPAARVSHPKAHRHHRRAHRHHRRRHHHS